MKTQLEDLIKKIADLASDRNYSSDRVRDKAVKDIMKRHAPEIEALLKLKEAEAKDIFEAGSRHGNLSSVCPDFKTFYKNYNKCIRVKNTTSKRQ